MSSPSTGAAPAAPITPAAAASVTATTLLSAHFTARHVCRRSLYLMVTCLCGCMMFRSSAAAAKDHAGPPPAANPKAASKAVPAPRTRTQERNMLRRGLRESTLLQRALCASRANVSERSQLQQAMAASLTVPSPPSIDPIQLALINSVVQERLAQDDLVEVVVPGNGDCLFLCAIQASESVGVPLRVRLSQLEVAVPDDEPITALHLRRGVANWIRHNRELFGRITADNEFKRRGLVRFAQPGAATGVASTLAAAASQGLSWKDLKPVWLDFEETLAELEKPGAWTIRYIEPCDPPADDPSLLNQSYLFDYLLSVLPFVLGASIQVFRKVNVLGQSDQADLMTKLQEGSFIVDPHDILMSEYAEEAEARAVHLQLAPTLQLPLLTLIQEPEQNHWHYAVLKATGAAPSAAAFSGGEAAMASQSSSGSSAAAAVSSAATPLSSPGASSATVPPAADKVHVKRIAFLSRVSCLHSMCYKGFLLASSSQRLFAHLCCFSVTCSVAGRQRQTRRVDAHVRDGRIRNRARGEQDERRQHHFGDGRAASSGQSSHRKPQHPQFQLIPFVSLLTSLTFPFCLSCSLVGD